MKLLKATTAVICVGFLLSMTSCIFSKKGHGNGHAKGKGSTTVVIKKTKK
jgi:hypothetical protein